MGYLLSIKVLDFYLSQSSDTFFKSTRSYLYVLFPQYTIYFQSDNLVSTAAFSFYYFPFFFFNACNLNANIAIFFQILILIALLDKDIDFAYSVARIFFYRNEIRIIVVPLKDVIS